MHRKKKVSLKIDKSIHTYLCKSINVWVEALDITVLTIATDFCKSIYKLSNKNIRVESL